MFIKFVYKKTVVYVNSTLSRNLNLSRDSISIMISSTSFNSLNSDTECILFQAALLDLEKVEYLRRKKEGPCRHQGV